MPEAIILMLAIVRIGAIHSVVFAGFGAGALADRIRMSGSQGRLRRRHHLAQGRDVDLKGIVDDALSGEEHAVEKVVVLQREAEPCPMESGRDITWDEFLAGGAGQDTGHVAMEANEPAFILATSGTTATPKLAVHIHGGYQVGIHSIGQWVMDLSPDDVWWSTSDIGWIVGHSYIVYAPLLAGATTIAFEGAIDHPGPETFYKIIEDNVVTGIFTSPTAVRLLMRYGEEAAAGVDLSSLDAGAVRRRGAQPAGLGVAPEEGPRRPRSRSSTTCGRRRPAGPVFGNPYGIAMLPIKPGSAGIPLPGWDVEIVDDDGKPSRARARRASSSSSGPSPA